MLETLLHNLRYGLRRLRREPGGAAIITITLAVGIGGCTAIFSLVNALLLRPLPFPESRQLATVYHHYPSLDLDASISVQGFLRYREAIPAFERVGVTSGMAANLVGEGEPVRVSGARASEGFLHAIGVEPAQGRFFTEEEDRPGKGQVVVISHGFWQRRLGGAPDVLGLEVRLNDLPYAVIGVMPPGFAIPGRHDTEFWIPMAFTEDERNRGYTSEWLFLVGRVRHGSDLATLQSDLDAYTVRLHEEIPDQIPENWGLKGVAIEDLAKRDLRAPLLVLLGAVGFVLLITCANVANLLLARSLGRRKEVAIRGALGAGRSRIVGQLITESLVLAVSGGFFGLLVAAAAIRGIAGIAPPQADLSGVTLNPVVLLFSLGVTILVGLLFGAAPAVRAARTDLQRTLREGGQASGSDGSGHGLRRFLVAAEFALALTLLTGAGLMLRTLSSLQSVDPGFDPKGVLTASLSLPATRYPDTDARASFVMRLLEDLESLPGVQAAGTTSVLPFGGSWSTSSFNVEGYTAAEEEPGPWGDIRMVSPGFDRALGLRLLAGRFLEGTDVRGAEWVCVVDDELVRRYLPEVDPLTRHIIFGVPDSEDAMRLRIVGVVAHTAHEGLDAGRRIQLYGTNMQFGGGVNLVVRAAGDPLSLASLLREAVRRVDPEMPVSRLETMEALIETSLGNRRVLATLLGIFAGLALLLATLGIYGTMTHLVGERSRELGVRMAFGASRGNLISLVLRQGLFLAVAGAVVGLLGSLAITRVLQSQLYGVSAVDPAVLLLVTVILLVTATAGILIPARRAAGLDPLVTLRGE